MKKKLALLTSALLVTSFALGATSCASKDTSKLLPETTPSTESNTTSLSVANVQSLDYFDSTGLVVVESETTTTINTDTGVRTETKTYKLFNLESNSYVSNASVTITRTYGGQSNVTPGSIITTQGSIVKFVDGLYYSTKTTSTGLSGDEKHKYTLYSADGVVCSDVEGKFENGYFVKANGERVYVNAFGKVVTETNPLNPLFTKGTAQKRGDYWVSLDQANDIASVYDSNGTFQYSVNLAKEFNMDSTAVNNYEMWNVGNTAFIQFSQYLPDDAKKYDYITSGMTQMGPVTVKANYFTYSYDLEKQKSKEIDFDYLVNYVEASYNDETCVLNCSEIIDQRVMAADFVQSFNKKGKVVVDLQKLVPGAESFDKVGKDTFAMSDGVKTYLCKEKEVVGEYFGDTLRFTNNAAYFTNGNCLYIYDANGNYKETITFADNTYVTKMVDGNLLYETDTSVCVYDTTNLTVSKNINKGNEYYIYGGVAVLVENYGTNNEDDAPQAETNDDTLSLYYLAGNASDILNVSEKTDDLVVSTAASDLDFETSSADVRGAIIKVSRGLTTDTAVPTVTYQYVAARTTK